MKLQPLLHILGIRKGRLLYTVLRCTMYGEATHRTTVVTALALDHNWIAWVVTKEALETEEGFETRTCKRYDRADSRTISKPDSATITKTIRVKVR